MSALLKSPETNAANCDSINRLEEALARCPQQPIPTMHTFTPGLYCRTVFMAKGSIFTSKIHKTEHPFVVSQGSCTVFDAEGNRVKITAPHLGVTKPGTRRALYIDEDCIWTTFHATPLTDVGQIEEQIIEPHYIPKVLDGSKCVQDIFIDRNPVEALK